MVLFEIRVGLIKNYYKIHRLVTDEIRVEEFEATSHRKKIIPKLPRKPFARRVMSVSASAHVRETIDRRRNAQPPKECARRYVPYEFFPSLLVHMRTMSSVEKTITLTNARLLLCPFSRPSLFTVVHPLEDFPKDFSFRYSLVSNEQVCRARRVREK